MNAIYISNTLKEFCTKFTAFGYKYCIELSKRFCKLVVIYAVKEFCKKYLTSELKCKLAVIYADPNLHAYLNDFKMSAVH